MWFGKKSAGPGKGPKTNVPTSANSTPAPLAGAPDPSGPLAAAATPPPAAAAAPVVRAPLEALMSSTAAPVKKLSWLARVGQILGRVLNVVGKDAAAVVNIAKPVAEALFPQYTAPIEAGASLLDNIASQVVAIEGVYAAGAKATGTGAQKLEAAVAAVGPAIDQWVAAKFPGAQQVSAASKAGLVNAVVAIMNELEGGQVTASTPTA